MCIVKIKDNTQYRYIKVEHQIQTFHQDYGCNLRVIIIN